jgi:hypothetical protein
MTILSLHKYHTVIIIRWLPLTDLYYFKKALNSFVKCVLGVFLMLCAYQSTFSPCEWGFMQSPMSVAQRDNAAYWCSLGWEFESWFEHYEQAEHDILLFVNSTWNSSGNQHSGSLVSKNRTAKKQYGIKGNFFVNHYSFIVNSFIFIFLPEQPNMIFRELLRKPKLIKGIN